MDNNRSFWHSDFLPQFSQGGASDTVPCPQPLPVVSAPVPLDLSQSTDAHSSSTSQSQPIGFETQPGNYSQWGPGPSDGYHNHVLYYNQALDPIQALLASNDAEIRALRDSHNCLNARVALLEEDKRALEEKNMTSSNLLGSLNALNDGFLQNLRTVRGENTKLLQEKGELQQEVDKLKDQLRNEKLKCETVATAREFLQDIQLKLISQKQEMAGKVGGLEVEVKTLKEKLARNEQSLKATEEELKSERERVEELKGEREELADIAKQYETEKDQLKKNCVDLEAEKEELTKEVDELQMESQNLQKDIKKVRDQNYPLKQTVERLGVKAERLSRENKVLKEEKKGLNDQKVAENSKIKELLNCSKLDLFTANMRVENLQAENKQLKEQIGRENNRAKKTRFDSYCKDQRD